jgi:hypothetical protein
MTPKHALTRTEAAHILALSTLAVAQPLLYVLGRNGEFFVASRTTPLELLGLLTIVVVGVPAVLIALELAAGLFGAGVRRRVHVALVAVLLAAAALPVLGKAWSGRAWYPLAAAAAIGALGAVAYVRLAIVRVMVSLLAVMPLVVAGSFLFFSDATKILLPGRAAAASAPKIAARTPVMLIIFDELPLASLLDENLAIDAERYPNFGQLAATSRWFRNATSVSDGTVHAVPAILTGRYPKEGMLATASQQPDNLFTLVGGSYTVHAHEPVTSLCPPAICRESTREPGHLAEFARDTAVVFGHVMLPRETAAKLLPPIDQGWAGFGDTSSSAESSSSKASSLRPEDWYQRGSENAVPVTAQPRTLYALHYMLPHVPWRFLPDGHQYREPRDIPGLGPGERWIGDEAAIEQAHQRHLLQVGYVDRVLGNLMTRLKGAGIYDHTLVIVVADHGCSFRPGDNRRHLTTTNWSDVLRVPLFVKLPGQHASIRDDRPVQNVDVLPTIADVLGTTLPFRVDGRSLLREDDRAPRGRVAVYDDNKRFTPPDDLAGLSETVSRNAALFGTGADTRRLFAGSRFWSLVGQPLAGLDVDRGGTFHAILAEPDRFASVDPGGASVPAMVSGVVTGIHPRPDMAAAIAVNGVIRGAGPLVTSGPDARFKVLVPGSAFQSGRNNVEVLVAEGTAGSIRLASAQRGAASYALRSTGGRESLVTASGTEIALTRDAVRGFVDTSSQVDVADYVSIWGWVVDRAHGGPPAVLVFADGRLVATAGPTADRPDVARAMRDPAALRSGFVVRIPQTDIGRARTIRLFGLSAKGSATELMYAADFPFLTTPEYRLVTSGGTEHLESPDHKAIDVREGAVPGYVDTWSLTQPAERLSLTGWAADPPFEVLPDIVVFADGRAVASVRPNQPRADIVAFFKDKRALLSGYRVQLKTSDVQDARRIRVFGVSRRGTATELLYPPDFPHKLPAALGTR